MKAGTCAACCICHAAHVPAFKSQTVHPCALLSLRTFVILSEGSRYPLRLSSWRTPVILRFAQDLPRRSEMLRSTRMTETKPAQHLVDSRILTRLPERTRWSKSVRDAI